MKKKGDVNWFMVTLIIAAVAVIVVIMMLRQQATKGVQGFEDIRGETGTDALTKCFLHCMTSHMVSQDPLKIDRK